MSLERMMLLLCCLSLKLGLLFHLPLLTYILSLVLIFAEYTIFFTLLNLKLIPFSCVGTMT